MPTPPRIHQAPLLPFLLATACGGEASTPPPAEYVGAAACAECQKPLGVLRPGMIASVRIFSPKNLTPENHQPGAQATGGETLRLSVPKKLILQEGGQPAVWIVDQSAQRAVKRTITLGRDSGDEWVEVVEGLQASDKLITSPRDNLKPNERVRITLEE